MSGWAGAGRTFQIAEAAIRGGADVVQLRDKAASSRRLYDIALQLRRLTRAAAIIAGLAKDLTPPDAVKRAKDYVTEAIRNGVSTGSGHGPTNDLAGVSGEW